MERNKSLVSRRGILLGALRGAGALWLSGCDNVFDRLHQNEKILSLLESVETGNRWLLRKLTGRNKLAQEFGVADISHYFKPNGNPPPSAASYRADAMGGWSRWRLDVGGLVKHPMRFCMSYLMILS
jgi:hypothetical protein